MRLRDAVRLSAIVCRLDTTDEKRFCTAPSVPRDELMAVSALSMYCIARLAPDTDERSSVAKPVVVTGAAAAVAGSMPRSAVVPAPPKVIVELDVSTRLPEVESTDAATWVCAEIALIASLTCATRACCVTAA